MPVKSSLLLRMPVFHALTDGGLLHCPMAMQYWIREQGSLTQQLKRRYGANFCVTVLWQGWASPDEDERVRLGLPRSQRALIREVILKTGNVPLILARSVMPASLLQSMPRTLKGLGNRPLGEVLFAHPRLGRSELRYARVLPALWRADVAIHQPIWGRRSRYTLAEEPLLVSEYFMPALQMQPAQFDALHRYDAGDRYGTSA